MEEMVKEKRRSDSEIIAMVTQAGITYQDEDGDMYFEVVTAFADDASGKIYFVCSEDGKANSEVVFFCHYMGEVSAVEDDEEFAMIASVYEGWLAGEQ